MFTVLANLPSVSYCKCTRGNLTETETEFLEPVPKLFSKHFVEKFGESNVPKEHNFKPMYFSQAKRTVSAWRFINLHDGIRALNVYLGTGALIICLGNSGIPNPGKNSSYPDVTSQYDSARNNGNVFVVVSLVDHDFLLEFFCHVYGIEKQVMLRWSKKSLVFFCIVLFLFQYYFVKTGTHYNDHPTCKSANHTKWHQLNGFEATVSGSAALRSAHLKRQNRWNHSNTFCINTAVCLRSNQPESTPKLFTTEH